MMPFLEKLLQVLAQGGFSSTYKYAVLLGLIDLCLEAGHPPTSVTTAELARRVVELYWPQVRAFPDQNRLLCQNRGLQATIARDIADFRQANPDLTSPPRGARPSVAFQRLLDDVEWALVRQPLPLLQRVGGGEERFIYEISWGRNVRRGPLTAVQRAMPSDFDNRICFVPGAAESLVALSAVVRPLVQQRWLSMVREINGLPDAELERFLFGTERVDVSALHGPLRRLQDGRCFYCRGSLSESQCQVDHFLPWSRYPDDCLDNLLLAHGRCNLNKFNFLADLDFGRHWQERSMEQNARLDEIAGETRWPRDRARTFGVVASVYQRVPDGIRLWAGVDRLRRVDVADLAAVHGFGFGLRPDA